MDTWLNVPTPVVQPYVVWVESKLVAPCACLFCDSIGRPNPSVVTSVSTVEVVPKFIAVSYVVRLGYV
jgi:hypothetical protein